MIGKSSVIAMSYDAGPYGPNGEDGLYYFMLHNDGMQ